VYLNYFRDLVFRREVHVNWPLWKETRNALGWIVCLPFFFSVALGGLLVLQWMEQFRQKDYEALILEMTKPSNISTNFFNAKIAERGFSCPPLCRLYAEKVNSEKGSCSPLRLLRRMGNSTL